MCLVPHSRYCDVAVNLDGKGGRHHRMLLESTTGMKNNKLPSLQAILDHARRPYLQNNSGPSSVCFRGSVLNTPHETPTRTPQSRCRETLSLDSRAWSPQGTGRNQRDSVDCGIVHLEGNCRNTRQRTAMYPAHWQLRLDLNLQFKAI